MTKLPEATSDPGPNGDGQSNLAAAIRRRFELLGGVVLEPLPRTPVRPPPRFGEVSYTANDR